jgi:hypothetical protein
MSNRTANSAHRYERIATRAAMDMHMCSARSDRSAMMRTARRRALPLAAGAVLIIGAAWELAPGIGPIIAFFAFLAGWLTCWVLLRDAKPLQGAAAPPVIYAPDQLSRLRHDLRGILSPSMLIADRLIGHEDPAVKRAGAIVASTVERAAARLDETKEASK